MKLTSHSFPVTIAIKIGLNNAIMLQHIYFWWEQNKENNRNKYDNRYWTYNSYSAFVNIFPYWSKSQIKRIMASLEEDGYIESGNYNKLRIDRTKWYTITDKSYDLFNINVNKINHCYSDIDSPRDEIIPPRDEFVPSGDGIVPPLPYINTNINSDVNSNKKENLKEKSKSHFSDSLAAENREEYSERNKKSLKTFKKEKKKGGCEIIYSKRSDKELDAPF